MNTLLITGATGHLGQAIVHLAVQSRWRVVATTRRNTEAPVGVHTWLPGLDLCKSDDLDRLRDAFDAAAVGRCHVVHAVGYFPAFADVAAQDLAALEQSVVANLLTTLNIAKTTVPTLIARGGGCLLAFSAHSLGNRYPSMVPFTAAKRGVEAVIEGLASEYSGKGLIPLALAPATIDSSEERARVPRGDFGSWLHADEVAEAALEVMRTATPLLAGNIIHLFRHSSAYFVDGFLRRIGEVDD